MGKKIVEKIGKKIILKNRQKNNFKKSSKKLFLENIFYDKKKPTLTQVRSEAEQTHLLLGRRGTAFAFCPLRWITAP